MRIFLKLQLLFLSLAAVAAKPALHIPLDGGLEVFDTAGSRIAEGTPFGKITYMNGVAGKGVEVKRHAYDQVGAVHFLKMPARKWDQGTVSFWFKPHWNLQQPGERWILVAATEPRAFTLGFLKKAGKGNLEFSIWAPGQIQLITPSPIQEDKWNHIALTWSAETGKVALYLNGKPVVAKMDKTKFKNLEKAKPYHFHLGESSEDRFKASVGDGVYDELDFFDHVLSDAEILELSLSAGKLAGKPEKRSTAPLKITDKTVEYLFFWEGKLPGVQTKIMDLDFGGNSLAVLYTGGSGKIAFLRGSHSREVFSRMVPNRKYKLSFEEREDGTECYFDGVPIGLLPGKMEAFKSISAVREVQLLKPEESTCGPEESALKNAAMSKLEAEFWNYDQAEIQQHGVRKSVCLNGYWRVCPVNEYDGVPPGQWGYMRVPGSHRSAVWQIYREKNGKLVPQNQIWNKRKLTEYRACWYQRVFQVPDVLESSGKRIYLNFENANADFGKVYLNGHPIWGFQQTFKNFTVIPNARRIDITDFLAPDGQNVLTLFVDRDYVEQQAVLSEHFEISLDNVWLESAPSQLALTRPLALPSFQKKTVTLQAVINNSAGMRGNAELVFVFKRDDDEKTFRKAVVLDGSPEQMVKFQERWEKPVLWDVENPNLYRMNISLLRDGKIADTLPERNFGFREVWVADGGFHINGRNAHLRCYSAPGLNRQRFYYGNPRAVVQYVAHIREMNFDTVRFDPFARTSLLGWKAYLDEADRQGLYNLFPMPPYEDDLKDEYATQVRRFLEYYGNHPNIIMWYTDMNTCSYPWDQDPAKLNDTTYVPAFKREARAKAAYAEKVMRALDPTRECFQHAGGNSGKIFSSMNYQSFGTPIQEQEDWPAQWAKKHTQPLFVIECGFPYIRQYLHFDNPDLGGYLRNSLAAEHATRFFGDSVFGDELRPLPHYDIEGYPLYDRNNPAVERLSDMQYRSVVKAWRGYGVSGIGDFQGGRDMHHTCHMYNRHKMIYPMPGSIKSSGFRPDHIDGTTQAHRLHVADYSQPDYQYKTVQEVFAPLLVFLGGDPENFTSKDHGFWSGEAFRKSIVIVNDHSTSRTLQLFWELACDGKVIDSGKRTVTAASGEILKEPIGLKAPEVFKKQPAELKITALCDGKLIREESISLQFFPKHDVRKFRDADAVLFDPEGKTAELLRKAGFPFRTAKNLDDIRRSRLLIIGQNALNENGIPELLKQIDSARLLEDGLKILVFEQKQNPMGNFVYESPSYRNAFVRIPSSPYLEGLGDEDLSNWRGSSDTVPPSVLSDEHSPHYPRSKWKCGNGGIVSGNVIRKPSYGNFRHIVDAGFNLMFSALMELRKEHGIVLFCQLDVTSRYLKDPAATRLTDNILEEMSKPYTPVGPRDTGYIGDDQYARILERMGMKFRRINPHTLQGADECMILIAGSGELNSGAKEMLRNSTRTVVMLPGVSLDIVPEKYYVKREKCQFFKAGLPAKEPLFEGIPEADLYFRRIQTQPVLTVKPAWTAASQPALLARLGDLVLLDIAPGAAQGLWNEEKISRVWSAVFTNLNVGLGKDLKLFSGETARHNTRIPKLGMISPTNAMLRLDPQNTGKPGDTTGFAPIELGKNWESQGYTQKNPHYKCPDDTPARLIKPYDGYAWYRAEVFIPESWKKANRIYFAGGPVDDCDWTYLNGKRIGETTFNNNKKPYDVIRNYSIPAELIRFGSVNQLEIKVFDRLGGGGVCGPVHIVADSPTTPSWSPYIDKLDFYDGDAFHNW